MLDELLKDLQNNPGEKYYWRAWNRLRLAQAQAAYDDAMAALNAMRNNEVYRLAGIASYSLNRLPEAREYFENALKMNGGDCDAQRYLGLIDSGGPQLEGRLRAFHRCCRLLRSGARAHGSRAGRTREGYYRSVERPHRKPSRRDQGSRDPSSDILSECVDRGAKREMIQSLV